MNLTTVAGTQVIAEYGRDRLHREILRSQGALWQHTEYDAAGRITERRVSAEESPWGTALSAQRFTWDEADNLVAQSRLRRAAGLRHGELDETEYAYDACDRLLAARDGDGGMRRWHYDEAGNRLAEAGESLLHNRPQRSGSARCRHDGFGRLAARHYPDGRVEQFHYNDEHQLARVDFSGHPELKRAEYSYDPAGRRTHKILTAHDGREERVTFLWCGLRLYGERTSRRPAQSVLYLYSEGSHEPLARAEQGDGRCRLHWYHTQLNGLPEELADGQGRKV